MIIIIKTVILSYLILSYLIRRVAGVLKGVFVLKLKAKCGLSNDEEKRKLGGKIHVFQNTFQYKARIEKSVILLVRIKKN